MNEYWIKVQYIYFWVTNTSNLNITNIRNSRTLWIALYWIKIGCTSLFGSVSEIWTRSGWKKTGSGLRSTGTQTRNRSVFFLLLLCILLSGLIQSVNGTMVGLPLFRHQHLITGLDVQSYCFLKTQRIFHWFYWFLNRLADFKYGERVGWHPLWFFALY